MLEPHVAVLGYEIHEHNGTPPTLPLGLKHRGTGVLLSLYAWLGNLWRLRYGLHGYRPYVWLGGSGDLPSAKTLLSFSRIVVRLQWALVCSRVISVSTTHAGSVPS